MSRGRKAAWWFFFAWFLVVIPVAVLTMGTSIALTLSLVFSTLCGGLGTFLAERADAKREAEKQQRAKMFPMSYTLTIDGKEYEGTI